MSDKDANKNIKQKSVTNIDGSFPSSNKDAMKVSNKDETELHDRDVGEMTEKRRDDRKRAASEAEEDTAEGSEKSVMVVKLKCDPCGKCFNSEQELNSHSESDHKALPTPEKVRSIVSCSELQLSPIHMERNEEKLSEQEGASSPAPSASPPLSLDVVCDLRRGFSQIPWYPECGKTFTNEDDLRVHVHLAHFTCFREKYSTPCPWEGCISHEVKQ